MLVSNIIDELPRLLVGGVLFGTLPMYNQEIRPEFETAENLESPFSVLILKDVTIY